MNKTKTDKKAVSTRFTTSDERMGMAWWNNMNEPERVEVLEQSSRLGGKSVADAWAFWKTGAVSAWKTHP